MGAASFRFCAIPHQPIGTTRTLMPSVRTPAKSRLRTLPAVDKEQGMPALCERARGGLGPVACPRASWTIEEFAGFEPFVEFGVGANGRGVDSPS